MVTSPAFALNRELGLPGICLSRGYIVLTRQGRPHRASTLGSLMDHHSWSWSVLLSLARFQFKGEPVRLPTAVQRVGSMHDRWEEDGVGAVKGSLF